MNELIKQTNAYKVISSDKLSSTLSHAYLVECGDKIMMRSYLKSLVKLILGTSEDDRISRLIDRETHSDITFYPSVGEKLKAAMADEIAASCIIKPIELGVRIFVVCGFEDFEKSQNKLLKTLEEPPKNVILLLGSSNLNAILPTVKSRVKKVDIPPFSENQLLSALSESYPDKEKLASAVRLSNGLEGNVKEIYEQGNVENIKALCLSVMSKLGSSRDIAECSSELKDVDLNMFLSVLKMVLCDALKCKSAGIGRLNDNSLDFLIEKYSSGAIIETIEAISQIERALHFNANRSMVIDKVLFCALEARYRWQKL